MSQQVQKPDKKKNPPATPKRETPHIEPKSPDPRRTESPPKAN
jgi:hypothetical protein